MSAKKQKSPDKKAQGLINYFISRIAEALKQKKKSSSK